jgi:hypothetical protein
VKATKTPLPVRGGTAIVKLAQEIERVRKADPGHYARIMRKLAELERRARELEQRSNF